MYSIHNEGKYVVAKRFIRTLKTKIYKYMTSVSKNVYIDKWDNIANEYNNRYHRTVKMKPVDVKEKTCIDSMELLHSNDKDPKFKVGDHVKISKYKNIFAKGYTPNWSEEVLLLIKLEIQFHGHMLLMILMEKKLCEHFVKKDCRRLIKKSIEQTKYLKERVINYMSNGKVKISHLLAGLIKKIWCDSIARV